MFKRIATASIVLALVATGAALAATKGTKVALHNESGVGKVLATSTGRTLYLYTPDNGKNKGTCTGACASTWPPLYTKGKPVAGPGVNKALLSTTKHPNGKLQVMYNHHPLYTYTGDSGAGQANGEGTEGIWFAVTAAGAQK